MASSSSTEMEVVVEAVAPISNAKSISITDISKTISYITRGVELNQPRLLQRAIRQNANVRKYVSASQLVEVVAKFVPASDPSFDIMNQAIAKIPNKESSETVETPTTVETAAIPPAAVLPEVEIFIFTLIVTTLLREKLDTDAAYTATALVERLRTFNRRSLDLLSSKAYFYFSLTYERIERLENIRPTLLALYRTACVHRDEMGQAVLLNLILRNYLHYNLIGQAHTLSNRAAFPESASNNQFCRYLYYIGRINAVQLEYSESYMKLMMAVRKAPQDDAGGFTRIVYKLAVLVQLLMGDIPERSLFNQPELRQSLKPYLALTQAVRNGNLQQFSEVSAKYATLFKSDKNDTLVQRLGHNVLKTGLRKLSVSYSRISLADVAAKLMLPSANAAEYICAKAIRDGVIEATIDHDAGWLASNDVVDVYSTEEPQKALHKRIGFCLDVHNEAVKSMRYPPDAYKKELAATKSGNDDDEEKTIDELIKEIQDDYDE